MIRYFLTGRHAHRTPLSYDALAPLFDGRLERVATPSRADLCIFAHTDDLRHCPQEVVLDWRARRRPVVVLSEEPFWDTIWGRAPLARHVRIDTDWGALPVEQITHQTSHLFRFARIPYYLLTDHAYLPAYAWRFRRNAQLSVADWMRSFRRRPMDISFLFERRPEPYHDIDLPEGDLIGLCAWRTRLAEACRRGRVERRGRSWGAADASRFALDHWHLDKLVRFDRRARSLAALENTHQPDYVSEKLFDAFACGSRPLYLASPGHGAHRLGLPETSWLNLYGLAAPEAAERAGAAFAPDFFEAYREAQILLERLFTDPLAAVEERARLRRALLDELETVLARAPAPDPAPVLAPVLAPDPAGGGTG